MSEQGPEKLPRVLLVGQGQSEMGSLRAQLEALGYPLEFCERGSDAPGLVKDGGVDLVIVDVTSPGVEGVRACRMIKEAGPGGVMPVLLATLRADRETRRMGAQAGADGFLNKPIEADELRSQVGLVYRTCRLTKDLRAENSRAEELNAKLLATQEVLDAELRLAQRLQGSMLPQGMPLYPKLTFAAGLRSSGAVSGDFYDVFRLDERHVGFYVADAIGHGVPAALLTIFVKKGIRTKQISGNTYRLLTPGEVLSELNHDMIEAGLSDTPFVTLFYGSVDLETSILSYSAGGHPSPLLMHPDGTSELLDVGGPLLGIIHDPYPTATVILKPGDRVIVYSDGVEHAKSGNGQAGMDWMKALFEKNGGLQLDKKVVQVMEAMTKSAQGKEGVNTGHLRDDMTVLAVLATG
ncbi:response regulator [bacterium]|nr:MAG: response regulator [bacterium]